MINHWNCLICKSYNDVLNNHCVICQANKPDWVTHEYQFRVEIQRDIWLHRIKGVESMTEQEELFSKFFNHEKVLVKDMDMVQLREHREELSRIAFEAKARLTAADDELRERKAKTSAKEWLVTTDASQTSSDAINAVKVRAARMSKMDKLRQQLLAAGIEENIVKEMVTNLERKATEKNVKAITFNKPSVEVSAVTVQIRKENGESKPFDPSTLSFGK